MKRTTLSVILCMLCMSNSIHAQKSLMAYWPFDGNANDSSGNGNNGTVYGAIPSADRFGRPGKAYYFDGASRIVVPNSSTLELGGTDFTIAFWMKVSTKDYDGIPLCKNQYGSWSGYLFFTRNQNTGYCTSTDHMSFYVASGAYGDVCSDQPVCASDSWHFITGVYKQASNQSLLYVDNVLQSSSGSASGQIANAENLCFGSHNNGTNNFFTGWLDDASIYNKALSPNEIDTLYHGNPIVLSANDFSRNSFQVNCYPNPSGGAFSLGFTLEKPGKVSISVFDNLGKLVYQNKQEFLSGNNQMQLDLSGLSKGMYLLNFVSGEKRYFQKLTLLE